MTMSSNMGISLLLEAQPPWESWSGAGYRRVALSTLKGRTGTSVVTPLHDIRVILCLK